MIACIIMEPSQLLFMQPSAVPPQRQHPLCALRPPCSRDYHTRWTPCIVRCVDDAGPATEPHVEENVCVREEALIEREIDDLCAVEACAEERADVLCVGQVKRSVDLVKDVHIGAGLNCSIAMISDSVMSDL